MQSLQNDNRQRGSILSTSAKTLQSGERRPSIVSHFVHNMQANIGVRHRGQSARALSSVPD